MVSHCRDHGRLLVIWIPAYLSGFTSWHCCPELVEGRKNHLQLLKDALFSPFLQFLHLYLLLGTPKPQPCPGRSGRKHSCIPIMHWHFTPYHDSIPLHSVISLLVSHPCVNSLRQGSISSEPTTYGNINIGKATPTLYTAEQRSFHSSKITCSCLSFTNGFCPYFIGTIFRSYKNVFNFFY